MQLITSVRGFFSANFVLLHSLLLYIILLRLNTAVTRCCSSIFTWVNELNIVVSPLVEVGWGLNKFGEDLHNLFTHYWVTSKRQQRLQADIRPADIGSYHNHTDTGTKLKLQRPLSSHARDDINVTDQPNIMINPESVALETAELLLFFFLQERSFF